ncbi:cell wall integrity and stress response component [Colletotrichum abscissum]|uniref:cell wall integrity and stress response component n=1 Tax=Colletotrichum abscissum TaxID=1671311 RepID=UPI0027D6025E|nr:cell wall integrity and stress response component [Colletotrichum abscissum]KAK1502266.1 cell wall integrity and stress response component [Colletotrichum abscissum]
MTICSSSNTATSAANSSVFQSSGLCAQFCDPWAFAILQQSQCWCSNESPVSGLTEASSCDSPCPGYPYESCGGKGLFSYVALHRVASPDDSITSMTSIPRQTSVETLYETRVTEGTLIKTVTQTVTVTKGGIEVPSDAPNITTTVLSSTRLAAPASSKKLNRAQLAGIIGGVLATILIVLVISVWSLRRRRTPLKQDDLNTGSVSDLTHFPGRLGVLRITNPD